MTDDHDPDELPLNEWIDVLLQLSMDPPADADPAEIAGLLGEALLEWYDQDGDDNHLFAAVGELTRALDVSPHHTGAAWWHYGLGLAHGELARLAAGLEGPGRAGVADHLERSVTQLTMAHRAWPAADPERDNVAVDLLEAAWKRFSWHAPDLEEDSPAAVAEVDRLERAMVGVTVGDADPHRIRYVRMLGGLALLARYDWAGRRRRDLDEGVAQLTAALAGLPPETPRYSFASAELAAGYLELAGLDEDPNSLSLAIAVANRAIRSGRPDQPGWLSLHRGQAFGYAARWDLDHDPADIAAAIECWRTVRADDPDPSSAIALAELLHSRAVRTGEADGLAEAVELLGGALPAAPDPAAVWCQLGATHLLRWQHGRAPESLAAARACVDRALTADASTEDVLAAHRIRLLALYEAVSDEDKVEPVATPATFEGLEQSLVEADRVLDEVTQASPADRGKLALVITYAEFARLAITMADPDLPRLRHLLATARVGIEGQPAGFAGAVDTAEGVVASFSAVTEFDSDSDYGMAAFSAALADQDFIAGSQGRALTSFTLVCRGARVGDLRSFRAGTAPLPTRGDAAAEETDATWSEFALFAAIIEVLRLGTHADVVGMGRALATVEELYGGLRPSRLSRHLLDPLVEACRDHYALLARATSESPRPRPPVPLPAGPLTPPDLLTILLTAGTQVHSATKHQDVGLLRHWADHLIGLAHRQLPLSGLRKSVLSLAGKAELARAAAAGDRGSAARAVRYLGQALAESVGPADPLWSDMVGDHAEALRRSGDPDRAATRRFGLSALQGQARQVLLQSGTDQALERARSAAAAAARVVRWCLQDEADDDLLTALDAGRSLTLHAATAGHTVVELLGRAGRNDLAAEWQDSGGLGRDHFTGDLLGAVVTAGEAPDDLRLRVLRALENAGLLDDLLTQVRTDEVRAALHGLDFDALVYLVPAAGAVPGLAVVVPAVGDILPLSFPDLLAGPGSPVRRLLAAALGPAVLGDAAAPGSRGVMLRPDTDVVATNGRPVAGTVPRDAGAVGGEVGGPAAVARATYIDDLCRWAWRAVVGRLIADLRGLRPDRPARVVLVPMGVFGLVPWHAAYEETVTGRRYAVHDLVISYAPSARILCATAARPVRAVRSALVVGDPLSDLRYAGIEAHAVYERFHHSGDFLGADPDPRRRASPEGVLAWIRAVRPGPSLLHFACHARVDPARPADAHLLLAGGPLPARELLQASRLAQLDLGQVFLAACTTHAAGGAYDEAFSLATCFLAAGAHTVFGSLWQVPDEGTSLLMYLVHHLLYEEGCAPADALHRAQLWMLDPDREPPAGMPAVLAAECSRPGLADPISWAAFTHQGR
ncbi:CHAT domain-containing protein [Micromonospora humida]|uniref:CHAT domain-containing protein n=1 Tax=Micromonospora humida TaxID=2809018 RepID=A0ABS2IPW1_9ACTN|nr:CHAT domain-containing protein [Micromonospora humida]MBM7075760.1 CHAT domain-containing protein [Micromonospora humida]